MNKVYYQVRFNGETDDCVTQCPTFRNGLMVGSSACQDCPYFGGDNWNRELYYSGQQQPYVLCAAAAKPSGKKAGQ